MHWWSGRTPRRDPATPATPPSITSDEVASLLDDLQRLRLTVTSDLSAAAGALDADEPTVARDILSSDRQEIAEFAARVKAGTTGAAGDAEIQPLALPEPRSRVRRRALLALPAVPLVGALAMTTAAALQATGGHHATSPTHPQSPSPAATAAVRDGLADAPNHTLRQLAQVLSHHPQASQVVAVADHFHAQLSALLQSTSDGSPHRDQVRRLLTAEQRLLERYPLPGVDVALAAARNLGRQLHLLQPSATPRSASPTPTSTSTPSKKGDASRRPFAPTSPRPTHVASHTNSPSPTPSSRHSHPTQTPPPNPLSGDGFVPNN